jgi:hypothetical protein
MKRCSALAVILVASVLAAPVANASGNHNTRPDLVRSIVLTIDKQRPSTGEVTFTIKPKGFKFVQVSDEGSPNVEGEGHAHVYAREVGTKKDRYIGWTGSGMTSTTDRGRLKAGKSYQIFAVFSSNDHTENWKVRSNTVVVSFGR